MIGIIIIIIITGDEQLENSENSSQNSEVNCTKIINQNTIFLSTLFHFYSISMQSTLTERRESPTPVTGATIEVISERVIKHLEKG